MLVFPQLSTGAAALYPVTRKRQARTVVNTLGDGRTVIYPDSGAAQTEWELRASGLTAAESGAIEALLEACLGQLNTFTFLDPAGNLLASSEAFGATAWNNGAAIQITAGIDDPWGTTRATRAVNSGQAAQGILQMLGVPGNFQYWLSVWARSAGGNSVTLTASTTGGTASQVFSLGGNWQRIGMPVRLGLNTSSVTFGAQLVAGASVDLFGMQVEAQPAESDYRKTGAQGGVYTKTRFSSDRVSITAQGTDVFDAVVRVVTNGF